MGVGRGVDVIIKGALTRILNTSLYSSLVSMLSRIGLKIDPATAAAGAGYKIADNIFCVP